MPSTAPIHAPRRALPSSETSTQASHSPHVTSHAAHADVDSVTHGRTAQTALSSAAARTAVVLGALTALPQAAGRMAPALSPAAWAPVVANVLTPPSDGRIPDPIPSVVSPPVFFAIIGAGVGFTFAAGAAMTWRIFRVQSRNTAQRRQHAAQIAASVQLANLPSPAIHAADVDAKALNTIELGVAHDGATVVVLQPGED